MMGKQAKCCVCTKAFQNVDIIKFKRKNYCYDCFEQSYPQDVVEQHYFYLHFQEVIGRPPTQVEWIQLKNENSRLRKSPPQNKGEQDKEKNT